MNKSEAYEQFVAALVEAFGIDASGIDGTVKPKFEGAFDGVTSFKSKAIKSKNPALSRVQTVMRIENYASFSQTSIQAPDTEALDFDVNQFMAGQLHDIEMAKEMLISGRDAE